MTFKYILVNDELKSQTNYYFYNNTLNFFTYLPIIFL